MLIKSDRLTQMLDRAQGLKGHEIIPYIDDYLENHPYGSGYRVEDGEKKPDQYFHPSGDTLRCKRELFFRLSPSFGLPKEKVDARLQRTFKIGHAVHAMVQSWFDEMDKLRGYPKLLGVEVKAFDPDLGIRGSVDADVEFPDGFQALIEIKTINSRQFAMLSSPKPLHKLQLLVYLHLRKRDNGIVLYVEKDYPHDMKEFPITNEPPMDVYRRWSGVREALLADDCSGLDFECKEGDTKWNRCPARDICRKVI